MRKFIFYGTKYNPFHCVPINQKTTLTDPSKLETCVKTNEIDNETHNTNSQNRILDSSHHLSQKSKKKENNEKLIQTRTTTLELSSDSEHSDYESLPDR
jgi:C-terminal processing protease CtpA/Prc